MRKGKLKKLYFNMIEVALAMAVIAFGMTSILGLFPVGLNASRNAIAENYCADAIDQIVSVIKGQAEMNATVYNNFFINSGHPNYLPDASGVNRNNTDLSNLSSSFTNEFIGGSLSNFTRAATGWTIFRDNSSSYIYFIVQGPNADTTVGGKMDFAAMVLVWKSPLSAPLAFGEPTDATSTATWTVYPNSDCSEFAGLNIEISWPLETEYNSRTKRYYYTIVSKP